MTCSNECFLHTLCVFISPYNDLTPHQTMFEDVSGFGAWQRLFFKMEGVILCYWNHPNEMGNKVGTSTALLCFLCSTCSYFFVMVCCSPVSLQRAPSLCVASTVWDLWRETSVLGLIPLNWWTLGPCNKTTATPWSSMIVLLIIN